MNSDILRRLRRAIFRRAQTADTFSAPRAVEQIALAELYRYKASTGASLPRFADAEFRAFSQNGEDGILLLLFSVLGMGDRQALEICAGDGIECNAANLVINHGWKALLIDGDAALVERGRRFYGRHPDTSTWPPRFAQAWVTAENINDLVVKNGFFGDIDLLSLDVDGMDYWLWRALDAVRPRVVVIEYQTAWGADASVTVRYDPSFRPLRDASGATVFGAGASLSALVRLGNRKGYRLVGVQKYGFNAFFVRDELGLDLFPSVPPQACFDHPHARRCVEEGGPSLRRYSWIEV